MFFLNTFKTLILHSNWIQSCLQAIFKKFELKTCTVCCLLRTLKIFYIIDFNAKSKVRFITILIICKRTQYGQSLNVWNLQNALACSVWNHKNLFLRKSSKILIPKWTTCKKKFCLINAHFQSSQSLSYLQSLRQCLELLYVF